MERISRLKCVRMERETPPSPSSTGSTSCVFVVSIPLMTVVHIVVVVFLPSDMPGFQLTYAPTAYRLLDGVFCIYKNAGVRLKDVRSIILQKLCDGEFGDQDTCLPDCHSFPVNTDLNHFEQRPIRERVCISGDQFQDSELSVATRTSYADHPLVVGPRYQPKDIPLLPAFHLQQQTSGLVVLGIGPRGCYLSNELRKGNFLKTYEITGIFGRATHNFFESGRTKEKTTFHKLSLERFKRLIAKTVSSHRPMVFRSLGIDLHSQEAYNLLAAGLTRPFSEQTAPLLLNLKILHFKPPDFTLQLQTVNEHQDFIGSLVHGLGLKMRSTACISTLRCTRYGYFTVDQTLLDKEWTVESVINNISWCSEHTTEDKLAPVSPNISPDDPAARASFLDMIEQNKDRFIITQSPVKR